MYQNALLNNDTLKKPPTQLRESDKASVVKQLSKTIDSVRALIIVRVSIKD
jgi:hypothetical protein